MQSLKQRNIAKQSVQWSSIVWIDALEYEKVVQKKIKLVKMPIDVVFLLVPLLLKSIVLRNGNRSLMGSLSQSMLSFYKDDFDVEELVL